MVLGLDLCSWNLKRSRTRSTWWPRSWRRRGREWSTRWSRWCSVAWLTNVQFSCFKLISPGQQFQHRGRPHASWSNCCGFESRQVKGFRLSSSLLILSSASLSKFLEEVQLYWCCEKKLMLNFEAWSESFFISLEISIFSRNRSLLRKQSGKKFVLNKNIEFVEFELIQCLRRKGRTESLRFNTCLSGRDMLSLCRAELCLVLVTKRAKKWEKEMCCNERKERRERERERQRLTVVEMIGERLRELKLIEKWERDLHWQLQRESEKWERNKRDR